MQKYDENYQERATYPDMELVRHLFGERNDNLKRIADALDVKIHTRGNTVHIQGEAIFATLARRSWISCINY